MSNKDIFISYSRKDLKKVAAIKKILEEATSIECWMDLDSIESGAIRFTKHIIAGIENCKVFLFMLSENSQHSEFALHELNFAMKKARNDESKHVVIVNIDNCQMNDEFEFMYGLTDNITWSNEPQRNKLVRDLKQWLKKDVEEVEVGEAVDEGTNVKEQKPTPTPSHPTESELGKWNWGAFFFSWIWGLGNGIYWPLVLIICIFIPYIGWIGYLIICITLGIKGTKWAWEAKDWDSWNSFKDNQHKWVIAIWWFLGIAFVIGFIAVL